MRFNDAEYARIEAKWPGPYTTHDEAVKVVYGWVKQDKISPEQMSELLVDAYKHFIY